MYKLFTIFVEKLQGNWVYPKLSEKISCCPSEYRIGIRTISELRNFGFWLTPLAKTHEIHNCWPWNVKVRVWSKLTWPYGQVVTDKWWPTDKINISIYQLHISRSTSWTQRNHPRRSFSSLEEVITKNARGLIRPEMTLNKRHWSKLHLHQHGWPDISSSWRFRMKDDETLAVLTQNCRWHAESPFYSDMVLK